MVSQSISKEIEIKFKRLVRQQLPKSNFYNALVINTADGLLCEYLSFLGIKAITAIVSNSSLIESLQSKLPNINMLNNLSEIGEKQFDLVCVLDKLDFLKNETDNQIFESITKNARYIVTDLFTYDSMSESDFKAFRLSGTEEIYMPTTLKVVNQFPDHLARNVYKESTPFKNVSNMVWHFRKRLPYAVIFSQDSYSGKTVAAKNLFSHLTHISLDQATIKIQNNELDASEPVKKILQTPDYLLKWHKKLYQVLADNDCYMDFVKTAFESYGDISQKDILVDGFAPLDQLENLQHFFTQAGYFVVQVDLKNMLKPDIKFNKEQVEHFYQQYHF